MTVETCSTPTPEKDLDFRPEFLAAQFRDLVAEGLPREVARGVIKNRAERDLGYLFLERYTKEEIVRYSYDVENGQLFSDRADVDNIHENGVNQREIEGKNSARERAEQEGYLLFKRQLISSESPQVFAWMSPPDPEACTDYSFYFFGKFDVGKGHVDMFAWRNEKPLWQQREELNAIADKEIISVEVHPNDFLRRPIFADGSDFAVFNRAIEGMPTQEEFENTKEADFSIYREGIADLAEMLSYLIAEGASVSTLRAAQLAIEMDFTHWVVDKPVQVRPMIEVRPLTSHAEFKSTVEEKFAQFVIAYQNKIDRFACGSCGGSIFSLSTSNSAIYLPSQLQSLASEIMPNYIACPGCGESVKRGSEECGSCGLRKSDYDLKKAA